jgi:hypothetical protein
MEIIKVGDVYFVIYQTNSIIIAFKKGYVHEVPTKSLRILYS